MEAIIILIFLALWVGCGWWGSNIMKSKGRSPVGGFFLGFLLGIFGLIIALLMQPSLDHRIQEERAIQSALQGDRMRSESRMGESRLQSHETDSELEQLRRRNAELRSRLEDEERRR